MNNILTADGYTNLRTESKKTNFEKTSTKLIYGAVVSSFLISIIYLVYKLSTLGQADMPNREQSDYVLMLLQCVGGLVVIHLPYVLNKGFKVEIPNAMQIFFSIFLFCAIFLGEVTSFYYIVPHWDSILHGSSGIMIGMLGFMMIAILNKSQKTKLNLSPFFMAMFAFCFAVMVGAIWEIYEFCMDAALGLNMQKAILQSGEALSGQLAIVDTMKDIIIDTCGAFIAATIGYISVKHKKGWINSYIHKNTANTAKTVKSVGGKYKRREEQAA